MIDFSALDGHEDMLTPGSPQVARLRTDAAQLLTQINERERLHIQKVVPIPAGMWNALFLLEPAGVVAKLSANENDFEVSFLREAGKLNIPVPQVFGAGTLEHPTITATYFLMSYLSNCANGWELAHAEDGGMTTAELEQLGADIGEVLARLHWVKLGYITHFGKKVDRWQDVLTDGFSPDWDHIAPNPLFDETLLPIFRRVLAQTNYFSFHDGTLVHGDLVLTNVLVDAESHRLRAVIDPGGYAGMPMFDLAYAAMPWDHGYVFHHAMLDSYRARGGTFDTALFYTSMLVVAYRHARFHIPAVREAIFRDVLPQIGI